MNLVQDVGYHALYIFKYSERPGTPAAKLEDNVTLSEKGERFLALEKTQRRNQAGIYQSFLGRELKVLAERISSKSDSDISGHSTCHKVVNFPRRLVELGQVATVRITDAKPNSLYGQALAAA